MEEVIAVSACLLGYNCKYDGSNNMSYPLIGLLKNKLVVPICPEFFGGLDTPRIPAEIQLDGRILDKLGHDVTACFVRGADVTWEILKKHHCHTVLLKDGSPSCGYKTIYDGTFQASKRSGEGFTAKLLREKGVDIIDLDAWVSQQG